MTFIYHIYISSIKSNHRLHVHPPRHPSLRDLLRLINQSHIQQKLRSTPNSTLKRREDPSMSVARVLANYQRKCHVSKYSHQTKTTRVNTYQTQCASQYGNKQANTAPAGPQWATPKRQPGTRCSPSRCDRTRRSTAPVRLRRGFRSSHAAP